MVARGLGSILSALFIVAGVALSGCLGNSGAPPGCVLAIRQTLEYRLNASNPVVGYTVELPLPTSTNSTLALVSDTIAFQSGSGTLGLSQHNGSAILTIGTAGNATLGAEIMVGGCANPPARSAVVGWSTETNRTPRAGHNQPELLTAGAQVVADPTTALFLHFQASLSQGDGNCHRDLWLQGDLQPQDGWTNVSGRDLTGCF